MALHSRLSPSSAERWIQCPGSIRLVDQSGRGGDNGSIYAEEGTHAHRMAELRALLEFGQMTVQEYELGVKHWQETAPAHVDAIGLVEMMDHANEYVEVLKDLVAERPRSTVVIEQKVQSGIPGCWGTADAIIISDTHVHVVDYKYGMGVAVDAVDNPQLKLYALGALEEFGSLGEIHTLCATIHQPRLDSLSHVCYSVDELLGWRDEEVRPQAMLALGTEGYLSPSEEACRWCPVAGDCKARAEHVLRQDFGNPDLLNPAEIGEILGRVDDIKNWCKAVDARALELAYSEDTRIPGWKVIRSSGRRSIKDHEGAIRALMAKKLRKKDVSRITTKPLGELEKLVGGKRKLTEILGDLIDPGQGKESLVPDDDDRPEISSLSAAREDFDAII